MELLSIVSLVLWVIIGVLNLATRKEISKSSYFLCWLVLILQLIDNCIK